MPLVTIDQRSKVMNRAIIVALVALLAVAVLVIYLLTDTARPENLICTNLHLTELRIRDYTAQNHRLPEKLSDLPPLSPDRDGRSTEDAWGRPLLYKPQADGSVILGSRWASGANWAITVHFNPTGIEEVQEKSTDAGRLLRIAYRIRAYAGQRHTVPAKLSDLPPPAGDVYSGTEDWWGRPVIYEPQPDGSVILASRGKEGNSNVITVRFTVRK
jgi:hypothetical protein